VSGRECTTFRLDPNRLSQKQIADPEFGSALEAVVTGVYEESGITIEREVRVLLPEKYPDVAIFQSTYRNLGKMPIHLDRVFSQRVLLDRKLAEPEEPSYAFA